MFIAESSTAQFDDFKQYAFELRTIATQNLAPQRIEEYLQIIYKDGGGLAMCNNVMDYIVVVLGKYLQMMVAYYIFKEEPDRVTSQFEHFNEQYAKLVRVFEKVTGRAYKPGQKSVATVKPIPRPANHKAAPALPPNLELNDFLEKNGISGLRELFAQQGITLEDVLEMDKSEVEDLGIPLYRDRKLLLRAIQNHKEENGKYSMFLYIYSILQRVFSNFPN